MTTVSQVIEQIGSNLHSFTGRIEATTYLTSAIDSSVTTIPVAHPVKVTQGIIEIDDELIHVNTLGSTTVEAMPGFGRGTSLSTAASHAQYAKVINDPDFPRVRIFEALKQAILQIQPDLFAVTTTTFITSPVKNTYEVPAGVKRVLKVQYETIGPSQEWPNVPLWSLDHNAATVSGKAIVVLSAIPAGRTVQITYATSFVSPASTSTDLENTCLIPAEMHDVLIYNVCWRLIQFMESYRLQMRAVEQQARAQGVEVGSASKVAQQMYAMYETRKREERKRLLDSYPPSKHFVAR